MENLEENDKKVLREKIKKEVAEYLKRGGKITKIKSYEQNYELLVKKMMSRKRRTKGRDQNKK